MQHGKLEKFLPFVLFLSVPLLANAQSTASTIVSVSANSSIAAQPVAGSSATTLELVGFTLAGDMPTVTYNLIAGECNAADGVTQIASTTQVGCWFLAPQSDYDVRTWGAVPGGGDSKGANASAINAAIAYVGALYPKLGKPTSPPPYPLPTQQVALASLTGGGLLYGVSSPVILGAKFIHFHDFSFLPVNDTNFPCATSSTITPTGVVNVSSGSHLAIDHIEVDSNLLPVNGFVLGTNGTIHVADLSVEHWYGSCPSGTTSTFTATAVSGSNVITLTGTETVANLGLTTGMIYHTAASPPPIPNLAVIVDIPSTTTFVISQPAPMTTPTTTTVSLAFSQDPSGIVLGLNGQNAGGTYTDINSMEWDGTADKDEANDPNLRFGYALDCTGNPSPPPMTIASCNNVSILHGQLESGVAPVFIDRGAGGLHLETVAIDNNAWSGSTTLPIVNPACIIMAADSGPLTVSNASELGCSTQVFITDSTSTPRISFTGLKYDTSPYTSLSPNAALQLWTNQVGANGADIVLDGNDSLMGSTSEWSARTDGNSTAYSFAALPNNAPYTGVPANYPVSTLYTVGDKSYTATAMPTTFALGYTDCSYSIRVHTAGFNVILTLPTAISGVGTNSGCTMRIFIDGTGTETLTPMSGAVLNGLTTTMPLAVNTGYQIWSVGEPSGGGGALGWAAK